MSKIRSQPNAPWRAAAVLLGGAWLGLLAGGQAASAAEGGQPRVTVVISPDVAGPAGPAGSCSGCDGELSTADALAGTADPLPRAEVSLQDGSGRELARANTVPEAFGVETATFAVAAPGAFTVALAAPAGWEPCPDRGVVRHLGVADFGAGGAARVDFTLWRGCPAAVGGAGSEPALAEAGVTAGPAQPSPEAAVASADGPGLPRTGTAVESTGRLMFGLAAAAVTCGLLGLAFESGLVRRS